MICILMGYMGSGKSSVGKKLSKERKINFVDLDQYIEQKEHLSVIELIEKSQLKFRKLESQYLKELLESSGSLVLSLGGGTPAYGENIRWIKQCPNATSFYLKASVSQLSQRLFSLRTTRPIIPKDVNSINHLQEFIGKHLFERISYYNQADFHIETDRKKIDQIAVEINTILNNSEG